MSFDYNNLSALHYANGHTHWHYRARRDTIDQVLQPGYFNGSANMLRVGDFISVNADADNPNRNHFQDALLSVKNNSGGLVLVSRLGEAPLSGGTATSPEAASATIDDRRWPHHRQSNSRIRARGD